MNTALTIMGLAMFVFIIVFSLKRAKEKRKAQQEEHEKIKEYGESMNEETRNLDKWKNFYGSWFWVCCDAKKKKEHLMSLDWNLIWKILQVVALLIIAREIDKRIRKRKK